MGIRSKIAVLPAAVRTELDRLIVERAFSGYQALAEWLQAQGYRISDDSVQRYGVRLRHQLDAIKLAGHQARAFAAAGKSARNTSNDLVAINAQQILQQTLGILLQAPEPCASPSRSDTTAEATATGCSNPGVSDAAIAESREKPAPVPADDEPKKLDVRDLIQLTRIIVDLSRTMKDQANRAGQLKEQARQAEANQTSSKPKRKGLSDESYHTIRNALLAPNQFTPLRQVVPPQAEAAADSVETTPEPKGTPSQSIESVPESLNPVKPQPSPLNAQPSPPETQSNPAEPTQPQLTAPDRINLHQTIHRVPIESITKWVWPTLFFPKPAPFPRPQARAVSPDPPQPDKETPEARLSPDPDRTREAHNQYLERELEVAPNAWTLRLGSRCSRLWADEEFGGDASRVK